MPSNRREASIRLCVPRKSWQLKAVEQPVHVYKVMPVVALVACVMDCVVTCSHDRLTPAMDAVVNVCGPHGSGKEEQLVCQGMEWHKKHHDDVWRGLENSINRIESQASKWR